MMAPRKSACFTSDSPLLGESSSCGSHLVLPPPSVGSFRAASQGLGRASAFLEPWRRRSFSMRRRKRRFDWRERSDKWNRGQLCAEEWWKLARRYPRHWVPTSWAGCAAAPTRRRSTTSVTSPVGFAFFAPSRLLSLFIAYATSDRGQMGLVRNTRKTAIRTRWKISPTWRLQRARGPGIGMGIRT